MILEGHEPHTSANRRGRPVLGGVAGFFLGLFLWVDLILFGVLPLESGVGYALPLLGILGGIALAMWAPYGRQPTTAVDVDPGPSPGPGNDQPNASTTPGGA